MARNLIIYSKEKYETANAIRTNTELNLYLIENRKTINLTQASQSEFYKWIDETMPPVEKKKGFRLLLYCYYY